MRRIVLAVIMTYATAVAYAGTGEPGQAADEGLSKTFSKSFPADRGDKIVISNQYGSTQVKTWDRKEVKVDAEIRAYSTKEGEARKLLDDVVIEAGKSGDQIVFKTKMDQGGDWGSGSKWGKKWRREVKIDYVVYLPASNSLTMSQNYGNITMGDFSGPLYVKVQYGNLNAGNLDNNSNYVSVQYGNTNIARLSNATVKQQYGSGLNISAGGTLDIDAQYTAVNLGSLSGDLRIKQQYGAGLTIASVDNLDLNAQYTNVKINTIKGNAQIRQQYNNLSIGSAGKISLNAQYTGTSIGSLKGDGSFNMQYNNLNISNISQACKTLVIDGGYLNINLGFVSGYDADLEVRTSYAGFNYGDGVSVKTSGNDSGTSKNYTGRIGKGGGGSVRIKSDYGGVTIK